MRCHECRYWGAYPGADDFDPDRDYTVHSGPSRPMGGKPCTNPKVGADYNNAAHESDDAANCYESFITGPMFGCIHFELIEGCEPTDFSPTRWWQVIGPDGSMWCETSNEKEARAKVREGDELFRVYCRTEHKRIKQNLLLPTGDEDVYNP